MYKIYHGNCLDILPKLPRFKCIFADPPDNINLGYGAYQDSLPEYEYLQLFTSWVDCFVKSADIVWLSFNAKWTLGVSGIISKLRGVKVKPCVQTFTFGQHNNSDLGNNYRPLWRLRRLCWPAVKMYPDQIRIESQRQLNGDKRANPDGRVPSDVFDFPRVTGNSTQRRKWHPTQLHEGLVERCIKLSTVESDMVCDPFAGTGTTLRVCKRINRPCVTIDIDQSYCEKISEENDVPLMGRNYFKH